MKSLILLAPLAIVISGCNGLSDEAFKAKGDKLYDQIEKDDREIVDEELFRIFADEYYVQNLEDEIVSEKIYQQNAFPITDCHAAIEKAKKNLTQEEDEKIKAAYEERSGILKTLKYFFMSYWKSYSDQNKITPYQMGKCIQAELNARKEGINILCRATSQQDARNEFDKYKKDIPELGADCQKFTVELDSLIRDDTDYSGFPYRYHKKKPQSEIEKYGEKLRNEYKSGL